MKRAAIEVQFHWMFILIIGAIILLFFMGIVMRQKGISEQYLATDMINNLEGIITGASVSPKTLHVIETPRIEIDFTCEDYSIKGVSSSVGQRIIFAPGRLLGRKLIPWALDWNIPFRATNFLFLATNELKFVFVNNDNDADLMEELYEDFMGSTGDFEGFTTELVSDVNNVKNTNNYKVRLIFYDTAPSIPAELQSMLDKDVTAINIIPHTVAIIPPAINNDYGTVEFYIKNNIAFNLIGTSVYLKKPSLIGAIFTEDAEVYNCVMAKAFKRVNIITDVYIKRVGLMTIGPPCSVLYSTAELQSIKSLTADFSSNSYMDMLYAEMSELVDRNRALQLASCPTIY